MRRGMRRFHKPPSLPPENNGTWVILDHVLAFGNLLYIIFKGYRLAFLVSFSSAFGAAFARSFVDVSYVKLEFCCVGFVRGALLLTIFFFSCVPEEGFFLA